MISRVLVPLDGSPLAEEALPYATAAARALKCGLTLLRVVTPSAFVAVASPDAAYLPPDVIDDLIDTELGQAGAYLQDTAQRIGTGLRSISTTVARGLAAEEIVQVADQLPGTLVIMSSHGRTGIGRAILGSVSEGVVRLGNAPVVLLRSGLAFSASQTPGMVIDRMLVPLDGSREAEAVLPWVIDLAAPFESRIVLVYVVGGSQGPEPSVPGPVRAQQAAVRVTLEGRGLRVEQKVLDGNPAEEISRSVQSGERALIAMATHARVGLDRLVSGSVAGDVFQSAPVPVLLVRAEAKASA